MDYQFFFHVFLSLAQLIVLLYNFQDAARRTEATLKAASSIRKKARDSPNVDAYVVQTKKMLELQMKAIQAQLDVVNELSNMGTNEERFDLLFTLLDKDGGMYLCG